jgi:RNA recognition motif-containing protein
MKKVIKKIVKKKFTPKGHSELERLSVGHLKKEPEISTIYVGNLKYEKTEQDLLRIFKKYGYVSFIRIERDRTTHKSKGIAFVQMPDKESSLKAIEKLNGALVDGRTLKVSLAVETAKKKTFKRSFKKTPRK